MLEKLEPQSEHEKVGVEYLGLELNLPQGWEKVVKPQSFLQIINSEGGNVIASPLAYSNELYQQGLDPKYDAELGEIARTSDGKMYICVKSASGGLSSQIDVDAHGVPRAYYNPPMWCELPQEIININH